MIPNFNESVVYSIDPKFISIIADYCRSCNYDPRKVNRIPAPLPTNKVDQIQREWMDEHEKDFLKKYIGTPGMGVEN